MPSIPSDCYFLNGNNHYFSKSNPYPNPYPNLYPITFGFHTQKIPKFPAQIRANPPNFRPQKQNSSYSNCANLRTSRQNPPIPLIPGWTTNGIDYQINAVFVPKKYPFKGYLRRFFTIYIIEPIIITITTMHGHQTYTFFSTSTTLVAVSVTKLVL